MPRNRSEKVPHPEVPKRFHRRIRLLKRMSFWNDDAAVHAYHDYVDSFTPKERQQYLDLGRTVRQEIGHYYRAQLEAELGHA